jgi:hypothetical protein
MMGGKGSRLSGNVAGGPDENDSISQQVRGAVWAECEGYYRERLESFVKMEKIRIDGKRSHSFSTLLDNFLRWIASVKQQNDRLQKSCSSSQEQIEELQGRCRELQKDMTKKQEELVVAENSWKKRMKQMEGEHRGAVAVYEKMIKDEGMKNQAAQQQIETMEKNWKMDVEWRENNLRHKLAARDDAHARLLEDQKTQHAKDISELKDQMVSAARKHDANMSAIIASHENAVSDLKAGHNYAVSELQKRLAAQAHQHKADMDAATKKYETMLNSMQSKHATTIGEMERSHAGTVEGLKQAHTASVKDLKNSHARKENHLNDKITALVGGLIANQEDSSCWTDERIKAKYDGLRRLIDDVTSPHFLVMQATPTAISRLDQNGFVARQGEDMFHFLVKSELWAVLQRQFFSARFGFGSLGPDQGKEELLKLYSSWRTLFDGAGESRESRPQISSVTCERVMLM